MTSTFRHDAYLDRGFERVRSYVSASPGCLRGDSATGLHLRGAGLDVSRDVRVTLGDLEAGSRFARIPLWWVDARRPTLYPALDAMLEINPVVCAGRPATHLTLTGGYAPPFGRFGAAVDRIVGHFLVLQSVRRFLEDLADRLERDIPPEPFRTN